MTCTHFIFHLNGKDVKIFLCVNELGKWVRIGFGHSLVAGSWKALNDVITSQNSTCSSSGKGEK